MAQYLIDLERFDSIPQSNASIIRPTAYPNSIGQIWYKNLINTNSVFEKTGYPKKTQIGSWALDQQTNMSISIRHSLTAN